MAETDRIRAIIGDYLDLSDQRSAQLMRLIEAELAAPADHVVGSENALAYRGSDAVLKFLRAVESTKALQNKQVRLTLAEAEELGAELRSPRAVDAPSAAPQMAVTDDRHVAALTTMAESNIPTDVQELLVSGDPMRGIAPGALSRALSAALPSDKMSGDNQSRYTTKRMHDEMAKAKAYGIELAAEAVVTFRCDTGEFLPRDQLVAAIRSKFDQAVSPTDHVAGWQPMETAPKDGKHCILAIKTGAFVYSIQGAYANGKWQNAADIDSEPLAWMPNVRLPAEFCPWTDEYKARLASAEVEG